jgi:hypothetical protein
MFLDRINKINRIEDRLILDRRNMKDMKRLLSEFLQKSLPQKSC